MTTVLGLFSCLKLHLVKQTHGHKKILFASFAVARIDAELRATASSISVCLLCGSVLAWSCNEFFLFCFEWYVCSALQFLHQTLWWRVALLCVLRPTHHTISPAKPQEPNLLPRSLGTEMGRSWNLQFIPRYH